VDVDDCYRLLQVDPSAEQEVIEAAYRRLARKYHPDVNPDPAAAARMRELSAAYHVLRDPECRAAYDRRRARWRLLLGAWRGRRAPGPPPTTHKVHAESPAAWTDRPTCWQHAASPAVDTCSVCGATLCRWCASPFRPAGCALCVMRRARRIQRRAALGAAIFAVAFLTVLTAVVPVGGRLWAGVLIAYLVAATALGIAVIAGRMWRSGWQDEPRDGGLGVAFLVWIGLLVGWLGAPLLLGKLAWDFKRGRELVGSAQAALQLP
jgi:DnaJ domain